MEKCFNCAQDMVVSKFKVEVNISPYERVIDCLVCDDCSSIVFLDNDVYSLHVAGAFFDVLSLESFRFLVECLKRVDYTTYFVVGEESLPIGKEAVAEIVGIHGLQVEKVTRELWKHRLLLEFEGCEKSFLIVNVSVLGIVDRKTLTSRNFFARDFFIEDNKSKEASRRRLLRKSALVNDFTDDDKSELLRRFDGKCALTGKVVPLHFDHVIPIAIGHGGTTKSNMLPIWQRINSSKSDRNIFEWYEENGERFEVCPERFEAAVEYLAELNDMSVEEYRDYVYECHANPNDILTKETV